MKLTFLGTGTSQGVPVVTCTCEVCSSDDFRDKRLRTSILIQSGDSDFVIDAGPDFRTQMLRESVRKLDAVLLTHAHHDHVSGLDDVRAFNYSQKMSMPVYGTTSCLAHVKRYFDYAFEEDKYPGVPEFNMIEIGHSSFDVKGINILPVPVMHGNLPINGFRIKNLAYITDASFIPESSMDILKSLDVLVINALRHRKHHSHFSFQEAFEVIEKLKPQKAYLTHISHIAGKHEILLTEMPARVQPAYDGLSICL